MAKHTQTIRRRIADKLSECVWPFRGVGTESVKIYKILILYFHIFREAL